MTQKVRASPSAIAAPVQSAQLDELVTCYTPEVGAAAPYQRPFVRVVELANRARLLGNR